MADSRPWLKRLAEGTPDPATESKVALVVPDEIGVSGTINWSGSLQSEGNVRLRHEKAFGTPGSQTWGEWENLHRTDHAVSSSLNLISAPLRDSTIEVDPAEVENGEAIAAFVQDNLCKWIAPQWATLAEQISIYGLAYGFALHEIVWGIRNDPRVVGGIAVYAKKLVQRLPSSVMTNGWIEKDGDLSIIRQSGQRDGVWHYNLELPAEKVLLSTWNRNGNNYQGFSAFRPVWYLGTMRADLLRILAIGSAREALGVPVVTTEKDVSLSKQQRDDLQKFIENIHYHENAGIQLPPGTKLEWIYSQGANKGNVLELWKALGLAIYETVQAQQTALGTDNTGSRAVGAVHDASKNGFVNGVRAWMEGVLNGVGDQAYTGIVKKIIDPNFGPQEEYPKVRIVLDAPTTDSGALASWATAVTSLANLGAITLGPADENYVREQMGMPPLEVGAAANIREIKPEHIQAGAVTVNEIRSYLGLDEIEGGDSLIPAGAEKLNPSQSAGQAPASLDPPPDAGAVVPEAPAALSESFTQFVPRRALRPNEEKLALTALNSFFENSAANFERTVKPLVLAMIRAARTKILAAVVGKDTSALERIEFDSTKLEKTIRGLIEKARAFGYKQASAEIGKRGPGDPRLPLKEMPGAVIHFVDKFKSELVLKPRKKGGLEPLRGEIRVTNVSELTDAQAKLVAARIKDRVKAQVWNEAVTAVRTGKGIDEAIDNVLADTESAAVLRTDAGIVLTRNFSIGREQAFKEHGVELLEYSAVMDQATCGPCEEVDGETFEPDSERHYELMPPYSECKGRDRCRCVLIPVDPTS